MRNELNQELAHIFEEMGLLYEMKDDVFRQRAYHRGSAILKGFAENIEEIFKKEGIKGLDKIQGIGKGMAEKIAEYIKTGKVKEYKKLKKDLPVNLEELTSVEGVGPKMVKTLYKKLKIKNLNELEKAAKAGKIQKLEGLGKKTEENILQGIGFVRDQGGRQLLGDALSYTRDLIEEIRKIKGVIKVSEAGSLRRRKETIGDVDILVASSDSKKVLDYVVGLRNVVKVWGRGPTKVSVYLKWGFDIDIRLVSKESYGAALQYFTGSKEHNVKLRQIAISKKYKLNEYGLFPARGGFASGGRGKVNVARGLDEALIYKKLGMKCMPPEMRENTGEIEIAQRKKLPKLIDYNSLRGDLQVQTNWTDGKHSIEEMANAAKEFGLEYIVITDHTKNLTITGGLNEKRLLAQKKYVDNLNKRIKGIRILSGSEVDILKDGSLDILDEVLGQLDVVGASVHSYFNLPRKEMTERILKAIRNPNVDILFHPTGRKINKRAPYDVDMEAIIKEAKNTGTILEINAHPERLDLRDEYIRMANEAGVKFSIDSDAHSRDGFEVLEYGIAQARRGWVEAKNIVNTYSLEKFLKLLKK